MSGRRRGALSLAVAALFLLSGCELRVLVGLDVGGDGSGRLTVTATLDRDAAERLRQSDAELRVDDLERAGWSVTGPTQASGGVAVITATKRFSTPAEVRRAVSELNNPDGPAVFRDFRISRSRSFAKTTTRFTGVVVLSAGIESFGDDELRERTGAPLGVEVPELERQADALADRFLQLRVGVALPGDIESNAPREDGGAATWRVALGQEATLAAAASRWNLSNLALAALATAAGVALVALLLVRRRRPA